MSLYAVRKELRKLKADGLTYTFQAVVDPDTSTLPLHGWGITKAAFRTEEYAKAAEEEAKLCEKCFGIPSEEMIKILFE